MRRRNSATSIFEVGSPFRLIVPELGEISRLTMRSEVVLPQPEGPTRTVNLPVGATSDSRFTAIAPPMYCFETFSNVITGSPHSRGRTRPQPTDSTLPASGPQCDAGAMGDRVSVVHPTHKGWPSDNQPAREPHSGAFVTLFGDQGHG